MSNRPEQDAKEAAASSSRRQIFEMFMFRQLRRWPTEGEVLHALPSVTEQLEIEIRARPSRRIHRSTTSATPPSDCREPPPCSHRSEDGNGQTEKPNGSTDQRVVTFNGSTIHCVQEAAIFDDRHLAAEFSIFLTDGDSPPNRRCRDIL